MKIVKRIWNFGIAFLLCLGLVGGFVILLGTHTVLNKEYVLQQLAKNDYYERIQTDFKNRLEEYQYQSGFPETVFENLYTEEWIKEDVDAMINHLYDGAEMINHSANIEEQVMANINQYLLENNIDLTKTEQQNVEAFQKIIVDVYEENINILPNQVSKLSNVLVKVGRRYKNSRKNNDWNGDRSDCDSAYYKFRRNRKWYWFAGNEFAIYWNSTRISSLYFDKAY